MQLPTASTATAFAAVSFVILFGDTPKNQALSTWNIFTACWALVFRSPRAPSLRSNPLMRDPLSLTVVRRSLRIDARFAQRLLKIHFERLRWTGILNYNIVKEILLCNLLFTPLQKAAEAHERKSTKTFCCQIIHNTADAISSLLHPPDSTLPFFPGE